jgi:hypothetical protein
MAEAEGRALPEQAERILRAVEELAPPAGAN